MGPLNQLSSMDHAQQARINIQTAFPQMQCQNSQPLPQHLPAPIQPASLSLLSFKAHSPQQSAQAIQQIKRIQNECMKRFLQDVMPQR